MYNDSDIAVKKLQNRSTGFTPRVCSLYSVYIPYVHGRVSFIVVMAKYVPSVTRATPQQKR